MRDNFIRRLQYAYPDVRIMAYLGRGKATQRIHMHMVSEGVPEEYIPPSNGIWAACAHRASAGALLL